MKKDYRPLHSLIVGLYFTITTPVAIVACYYYYYIPLSQFHVAEYTLTAVQRHIPDFAFSALIGVSSLICWRGYHRRFKWAGPAWCILMTILSIAGVIYFIASPTIIAALKELIYAFITFAAYSQFLQNKKTEQDGPPNDPQLGSFEGGPV